jgi:hypothetical protein
MQNELPFLICAQANAQAALYFKIFEIYTNNIFSNTFFSNTLVFIS